MINWGIIGTGNIAHSFADDFRFSRGGNIEAVASRNVAKARDFAYTYGVKTAYGSYSELLLDESIDAVYIATPHHLHYELAAEAIANGRNVLSEKPITTNVAELKHLMQLAREKNCYLMEAMWTYFLPPILKAKEWVANGRIGKLKGIDATFGFKAQFDPQSRLFDPKLGGGALLDIGIYPIAIAQLFVDQMPKQMHVVSSKAKTGVDREETMRFEYENGIIANLLASFRFNLTNEATIIGERGSIRIPEFFKATECFLQENDKLVDSFIDKRKSAGYNYEIEAVQQDLEAGRTESSVMPLQASLELQQTMETVRSKM